MSTSTSNNILALSPTGQFGLENAAATVFSRPWGLVQDKGLGVQILVTIAIIIGTLGIAFIGLIVRACINIHLFKNNENSPQNPLLRFQKLSIGASLLAKTESTDRDDCIKQMNKAEISDDFTTAIKHGDFGKMQTALLTIGNNLKTAILPQIMRNSLIDALKKSQAYSTESTDNSSIVNYVPTCTQAGSASRGGQSIIDIHSIVSNNTSALLSELLGLTALSLETASYLIEINALISNPTSYTKEAQKQVLLKMFVGNLQISGPLGQVYEEEMHKFIDKMDMTPIYEEAAKQHSAQHAVATAMLLIGEKVLLHFTDVSVLKSIWSNDSAVMIVGNETVDYYRYLYSLSGSQKYLNETILPIVNMYKQNKARFGIAQDSTLLDRISQRQLMDR